MGKDSPEAAPPVLQQDLGTLEVAGRVFQDIVTRVAQDVPGVATVSRPTPGLFRRGTGETVRVERAHGEVALTVRLTVRYDVSIPDLVGDLRQRVARAIEEGTGYRVRALNVTIEHILPPDFDRQEPAPPSRAGAPASAGEGPPPGVPLPKRLIRHRPQPASAGEGPPPGVACPEPPPIPGRE